MKEVKAIVKPFKLNDILNDLLDTGYTKITVTFAEGTGSFKSDESSISSQFSITDSKVAIIIIVCNDSEVENIAGIISSQGRTGNPGDGIIYVSEVSKVYDVTTGLENGKI
jgi:nitrogen regulatory protein P-II 1